MLLNLVKEGYNNKLEDISFGDLYSKGKLEENEINSRPCSCYKKYKLGLV